MQELFIQPSIDSLIKDHFFIRIVVDLIALFSIVWLIHFKTYRKKEFVFTYTMFNIVIFFISFILQKVNLSMGAAFGLFAVFSIIRYRTEDITQRDMTYLFVVIAIGMISATHSGSWLEVAIYNGIIVTIVFVLESSMIYKRESSQSINYGNLDLIKKEKREELIKDIEDQTGFKIIRIQIGKIDMVNGTVNVKIYYNE